MDDFGSPVAASSAAGDSGVSSGIGVSSLGAEAYQPHGLDESHALRIRRGYEGVDEDQPQETGAGAVGLAGFAGSAVHRLHDLHQLALIARVISYFKGGRHTAPAFFLGRAAILPAAAVVGQARSLRGPRRPALRRTKRAPRCAFEGDPQALLAFFGIARAVLTAVLIERGGRPRAR